MNIIGRKAEQSLLAECINSDRPEFIVVYGRRRVGKTFLIKEYFDNTFSFYASGVDNVNTQEQLRYFNDSLLDYGSHDKSVPQSWREAFLRLKKLLTNPDVTRDPLSNRKIVFFDEMPWMDTARSDFMPAFEHFWNTWGADQRDLLLIVCGSATSWIIENVLQNNHGLYNRITRQIHLTPFSLKECEEYYASNGMIMTRSDIIESYMIFGGIPHYMNLLSRRMSLAQNIDSLLFRQTGQLYYEYDRLFRSLYKKPEKHLAIIRALSTKRSGLMRTEIIEETGIANGLLLTKALTELEQCGFIRKYKNFSTTKNSCFYQIVDPFVLFYHTFLSKNKTTSWIKYVGTPGYNAWRGLAFETVCLNHIPQIKNALGISGIDSIESAWRSKFSTPGAQIDLLIDRSDNVINICEMKFTTDPFEIDATYVSDLNRKMEAFRIESKTKKALHLTLVSASGLAQNKYSGMIINTISGDELFE